MNDLIVQVTGLSHRYSVQWAVKNINLELRGQGVYGLLGSNGAGKSTIMNIMCGVLKQTQGEVFIKGISLKDNPVAAKRHLGFLPQQAPLLMDLTVEEYLTYCANLRFVESQNIKKAVSEAMEAVQIEHFCKRVIRNLSGGFQQRVGIAQAIIHKPDFVVLDEPTNGLDPNQILEVRNLIRNIAKERTVILSTHILQEVQALCDNIWMVNEGEVVFSGSMDNFNNYIQPDTLLVSFLAMPPESELLKLEGVHGVELLDDTNCRIKFTNLIQVTERIVQASVHNQWRLVGITAEKNSLEAIFAELSKAKALH